MNMRDFVSSLTLALALSSGVLYGACNKPDAAAKENEAIRSRPKYGSRFEAAMRELLPRLGFEVPAIEGEQEEQEEGRQPTVPEQGRGGTDGPVPAIR